LANDHYYIRTDFMTSNK